MWAQIRTFDHTIALLINAWASASPSHTAVAVASADYMLAALALLTLYAIWRTVAHNERIGALVYASVATASAYILKVLIGFMWFRARPFVSLQGIHALIAEPITSHSFPSGHATVAGALACIAYRYDRTWGIAAWILAIDVALGRVLAGVHYPTDVVAGLLLGCTTAYVFFRKKKRTA